MILKRLFKGNQGEQPQPGKTGTGRFRLVRYFTLTSLGMLVLVALALTYFVTRQDDFFTGEAREDSQFLRQVQQDLAMQHDDAARRDLLAIHEAGNVNLARLFENALWKNDFAPFVARAQAISVQECRAMADVRDEKDGGMKPPREKNACFSELGKKFMALPGFADLNAKVYSAMRKSTVFKIKVYDLRGITLYSSEHAQIGEDKAGNAGWMGAAREGKSSSELTHRDKFSAFEGVVEKCDLISVYLPVLLPGSDTIVGVFEVYSDVTPFLEQIKKTSAGIKKISADNLAKWEQADVAGHAKMETEGRRTLTFALLLMLALFGALLMIVRRADGIIVKQESEGKKSVEALRERESRFRLMFERTADALLLLDPQAGQFIDCNQAATDMLHCTDKNEILLLHPAQLSPPYQPDGRPSAEKADEMIATALKSGSYRFEWLHRSAHREDFPVEVLLTPLLMGEQQLIITTWRDITERKAAQDFALAQDQVLALIAGGVALPQSLDAIVRLMEKTSPGSLCSILLLQGQELRHGVAPSLPDSYKQAIDGLRIGDGAGACGTAAFSKLPVVVEDAERDPLMHDYRELLRAHGLRACWSTPVLSGNGEVLATFAVYRRTPGRPQARDTELIAKATRLARIALERAHAEAALVDSEARFRELAENIDDVFFNVDAATGRMLYVSPGYKKISGRSCKSLYANPRSYLDVVVAEDRPVLKRANQRNQAGERSDVEYRILDAAGQTLWIRDQRYPVLNPAGKVERVVGSSRDITERKLADLALVRTNRALQMLSRTGAAINRADDEARMLAEVCHVAVDVGGYRMAWVGYAQDDEARSIQPAAAAGDDSGYLASIAVSWRGDHATGQGPAGRAIRSGQPEQSGDISGNANFHWQAAALQRGYRSAICLPLRDGQRTFGVLCLYAVEVQQFAAEVDLLQELADNLAFGIGSLRARLERQRSQDAARQAAAQLREQASLLDRAQDAIMVRNLDRTIRYWNKGAERLYGWTAEEVLGKTLDELMYRSPQVLITAMNQTLARDGDWSGELEQVARDGSTITIEGRWTVVRDEQGRVNGVMGINTDIGERLRAREEILQLNASLEERVQQRTAQLASANKQMESFSYSVSHDLRSPLNAIDGFSSLLEKTVAKMESGPLTERGAHYLARIRAGVSQMGNLIDALLSLAQVSRASLLWEPVDLSALAGALLERYQEREPARAVRLQVEAGLLAQGDSRLLNQVLDNLLGNAWKFSARQPCTEITVGHEQGSSGETVYFVRDNGAGFDMAYADKLFGAFQRLHTPDEFAGTGIGLATVHRIIVRHGGRIWGESAPGQGATFYFTLGLENGA